MVLLGGVRRRDPASAYRHLGAVALARVPVATYLRYYALLVLGDVDADLDLVPERRATVRAESE